MNFQNITPFTNEDLELFASVADHYRSVNEKIFFETLKNKIQNEPAMSNDLLLSEFDNADGLYLVRCYSSEFILGKHQGGHFSPEYTTMDLHDVLHANLFELSFLDRDITFWAWLKEHDYKEIMYNHNYDLM